MGKRGPKPGNYREPVEKREVARPNPLPGMPEGARTVWKRIVSAMPAGYFKPQHYDALRAFCAASYRHSLAVGQLEKLEGALLATPDADDGAGCSLKDAATKCRYWTAVKASEAAIIVSAGTKLGIHKNSTWGLKGAGADEPAKPKSRRGDLIAIPRRGGGE